jgi:hypothetical protein
MRKTENLVVRRLWQFGLAGGIAYAAFWAWAYYATESPHPTRQFIGALARLTGPKASRTVREFEMDQAIFHLRHAMYSKYQTEDFVKGRKFPTSWEELIQNVGSYRGPHLRGTLLDTYPFLKEPVDLWGNPWVYRVVELDDRDKETATLRIFCGSLGPDGRECPPTNDDFYARRRKCDDSLLRYLITGAPPSIVPPRTPLAPMGHDHKS